MAYTYYRHLETKRLYNPHVGEVSLIGVSDLSPATLEERARFINEIKKQDKIVLILDESREQEREDLVDSMNMNTSTLTYNTLAKVHGKKIDELQGYAHAYRKIARQHGLRDDLVPVYHLLARIPTIERGLIRGIPREKLIRQIAASCPWEMKNTPSQENTEKGDPFFVQETKARYSVLQSSFSRLEGLMLSYLASGYEDLALVHGLVGPYLEKELPCTYLGMSGTTGVITSPGKARALEEFLTGETRCLQTWEEFVQQCVAGETKEEGCTSMQQEYKQCRSFVDLVNELEQLIFPWGTVFAAPSFFELPGRNPNLIVGCGTTRQKNYNKELAILNKWSHVVLEQSDPTEHTLPWYYLKQRPGSVLPMFSHSTPKKDIMFHTEHIDLLKEYGVEKNAPFYYALACASVQRNGKNKDPTNHSDMRKICEEVGCAIPTTCLDVPGLAGVGSLVDRYVWYVKYLTELAPRLESLVSQLSGDVALIVDPRHVSLAYESITTKPVQPLKWPAFVESMNIPYVSNAIREIEKR